jgi:hypothetical protein
VSKFFEALARSQRPDRPANSEAPPSRAKSERRRSRRWKALIPIFVYGHGSGLEPFHEEAYSAVVSETGGLLVMNATVQLGQSLLLTNRATQEARKCRVAYVGARERDQPAVAVEFAEPTEDFWRLTERNKAAGLDVDEVADGDEGQRRAS